MQLQKFCCGFFCFNWALWNQFDKYLDLNLDFEAGVQKSWQHKISHFVSQLNNKSLQTIFFLKFQIKWNFIMNFIMNSSIS